MNHSMYHGLSLCVIVLGNIPQILWFCFFVFFYNAVLLTKTEKSFGEAKHVGGSIVLHLILAYTKSYIFLVILVNQDLNTIF